MVQEKTNVPLNFFLYAHACGDILVKRGAVSKQDLETLRSNIARGKSGNPLLFRNAYLRVLDFARRRKRKLTSELIREYFVSKHTEVVLRVAKKKKDVVPVNCFITPAKILSIHGDRADALTPFGKRTLNLKCARAKKGDLVSTHYWWVCEKMSAKEFMHLWNELKKFDDSTKIVDDPAEKNW